MKTNIGDDVVVEKQPLQNQAYEFLFNAILENTFEDGVMYSEGQLTEWLNISRTPIRSALQRLQADGYIDIYPSRGFKLHTVTKEDLQEAFQTCIAHEGYCAFCLAQSPSCASIVTGLREAIQLQSQCEQTGDIAAFIEADRQFHWQIVHSLHNNSFDFAFTVYRYKIKKFLSESLSKPGAISRSIQDHMDIVQAISNHHLSQMLGLLQRHHNDF